MVKESPKNVFEIEFYLKSTLTIEESFVTSKLLSNQIEMMDKSVLLSFKKRGYDTRITRYTQYRFIRKDL